MLSGQVRGYDLTPDAFSPYKANRDQRERDMVEITTKARRTIDRSDYDNKQLCTFLFIFANAIFHELCHLFPTFITKGQIYTPSHLTAPVEGYVKGNRGETGRFWKSLLFGGTLKYNRDPNRGNR